MIIGHNVGKILNFKSNVLVKYILFTTHLYGWGVKIFNQHLILMVDVIDIDASLTNGNVLRCLCFKFFYN
jgi:hypothetical protein